MAQKLICNLPNREDNAEQYCSGVVLHRISPRMVQIGRQGKQRISVYGQDWTIMVTCPKCGREHTLVCKNGALVAEQDRKYEEIEVQDQPAPDDPNDRNNPDANPITPPAEGELKPGEAPVK